MDKQIRYILDETANNPNNLVELEPHYLEDRRFKCMTLIQGSFFVDDLLVYQSETDYLLEHKKDYVYADIDVETSTRLGHVVANVIIIVNPKLGRKFKVTYRAVGLPIGAINERTVALLQAPPASEFSDSYLDLRNKPEGFKPTFHYHKLSEIEKFQLMLFYLEKIRIAITYENSEPLRIYLSTVDNILQSLIEKASSVFLSNIEIELDNLKKLFTKYNYGVNKISNLPILPSSVTEKIGKSQDVDEDSEGYLILKGLLSFKNAIYSNYLAADYTSLGREVALIAPPYLETLVQLRVGSTVIFDSFDNNIQNGLAFERLAYPNLARTNSRFVIKKIANSNDNYSLVLAVEVLTSKVFTGKVTKTNVGILTEWKEFKKPENIISSLDKVGRHLSNRLNPHHDNKDDVDLGKVENLPLATTLEIITDASVRSYITWAQLDRLMKRYLLKRRPHKTEQLTTKDENLMRNVSVVFSRCGKGCGNDCAVEGVTAAPTTTTTTTTTTAAPIVWGVSPNTVEVKENETVTFTVTATNLQSSRNFHWTLEGQGVQASCFVGGTITGTSSISATNQVQIQLKGKQDVLNLKNFKMVIRDGSSSGPIVATSELVHVNVIVFDADYFVVEYLFTDGLDLDTRTYLTAPVVSDKIGWCRAEQWPTEVVRQDAVMVWGGDNTGTGTETILFRVDKFKELHPNATNIGIVCDAFWYNTRGYNPVGIKVTLYKGGTPVLDGYHWTVPDNTSNREAVSTQKIVTINQNSCIEGENVANITCDLINNLWTIS